MSREPIDKAIKVKGGVRKLAEMLGITGPAISQWKCVPVKHVLAISDLTGIPPHKIRPDIYRRPSGRAVA